MGITSCVECLSNNSFNEVLIRQVAPEHTECPPTFPEIHADLSVHKRVGIQGRIRIICVAGNRISAILRTDLDEAPKLLRQIEIVAC